MACSTDAVPATSVTWSDRGATAVEYALLMLLVAAVIMGVIGFLGQDVEDLFTSVNW